jgi:GNAT superfamily N-acetyltransferase
LEIREAKPEDENELRTLQKSCPQGTTLVVSTVNIPDFFSRVRAYESYKVYVACEGGKIVGSAAVTVREIMINGVKTPSGYEFQYFTSPSHRRKGIANKLHNHIENYLNGQGAIITFGLIIGGNIPSISVAESQGFSLYRTLSMHLLMVHKEINMPSGLNIRPARPEDLSYVASLLNNTWSKYDFYEPVSDEYLKRFIDRAPGIDLHNFTILEEEGKILACLGFQEWSSVMKITVKSLSFKLRAVGLLLNILRLFVSMPGRIKPGDVLNQIMITTIAYKDPVYFSILLKYINNFALKRGITQMFFVCEPEHVLSKSLKGFTRTASKLHLYVKPLIAAQSDMESTAQILSEATLSGEPATEKDFFKRALRANNPVYINGIDL